MGTMPVGSSSNNSLTQTRRISERELTQKDRINDRSNWGEDGPGVEREMFKSPHNCDLLNEVKYTCCDKTVDKQFALRKMILKIQGDSTISEVQKARKMQDLMSTSWKRHVTQRKKKIAWVNAQQHKHCRRTPGEVTGDDVKLSYHDIEKEILGCKHYQRSIKLQCDHCNIWSVCRFCHDEISDHDITSAQISRMMCMYCETVQPIGQVCINEGCKKVLASYFCKTCLLWDSDKNKNIYHCDKCGICRIGKGFGIDYFHCDKCGVCLAISLYKKHRCIERNIECNCPICGEYMFTSTSTIMFMVITLIIQSVFGEKRLKYVPIQRCCHCIHVKCYKEYIKKYYQCPTCFKSLADMTELYNRIDVLLALEQMPMEYEHWYSRIYCNDCEIKCVAKYHFIYHKCLSCQGYNTKVVDIVKNSDEISEEDLLRINENRKKIQLKALEVQCNATKPSHQPQRLPSAE